MKKKFSFIKDVCSFYTNFNFCKKNLLLLGIGKNDLVEDGF